MLLCEVWEGPGNRRTKAYKEWAAEQAARDILTEEELANVIKFLTTKEHHSLSCVNQFTAMPETYFFSADQVDPPPSTPHPEP